MTANRIVIGVGTATCLGAMLASTPPAVPPAPAPSGSAPAAPAPPSGPAPASQPAAAPPPSTVARDLTDAQAREILGQLAGFWSVTGSSYDAQGSPTGNLTGSAAYSWSLGGLFLAGEQMLTDGSEMVQWIDLLGFNDVTQSFSRTLLSDRDAANYCAIGLWYPRSRLLTFVTDPLRGPDGADRRIRSTLDLSQADRPSWELAYFIGAGADERQVASVKLALVRAAPPASATPVPSGPLIPGGGSAQPAPSPGRSAPGGARSPALGAGPMTPAQVQSRLDSVVRQRQQMQQQIEDMRRQMREMSGSIRRITQP